MKFYFARHGESLANTQQVLWNQPVKFGLTDLGKSQARVFADNLAGISFAALYCSPVLRAVQTARIVGRRIGLAPEVSEGLREWDVGTLEGQKYSPEIDALHRQVTMEWLINANHEARIEGGESFTDIVGRFMPLIKGLARSYGGSDANLLLISHGGTLTCMLPLLLANIDNNFSLSHGTPYATPIVAEERNGKWMCLRWGDIVF